MRRCDRCGLRLTYRRRGRPHRWCGRCKKRSLAEKQRAYYEANRGALAEKQRAYYEANRGAIAEKQRAYREANRGALAEKKRAYREARQIKKQSVGLSCAECGEILARRTEDGLCGFCSSGLSDERGEVPC